MCVCRAKADVRLGLLTLSEELRKIGERLLSLCVLSLYPFLYLYLFTSERPALPLSPPPRVLENEGG